MRRCRRAARRSRQRRGCIRQLVGPPPRRPPVRSPTASTKWRSVTVAYQSGTAAWSAGTSGLPVLRATPLLPFCCCSRSHYCSCITCRALLAFVRILGSPQSAAPRSICGCPCGVDLSGLDRHLTKFTPRAGRANPIHRLASRSWPPGGRRAHDERPRRGDQRPPWREIQSTSSCSPPRSRPLWMASAGQR